MHRGQLYAQCTEFSIPPPGDGAAVIASILLQLVLCYGELSGCKATPRASEGLLTSQQWLCLGYVHGGKAARVSRAVLQALRAQPGVARSSARCSGGTQSSTEHFAGTAVPVPRSGANVAHITCEGNSLGDWIALPNSVTSR